MKVVVFLVGVLYMIFSFYVFLYTGTVQLVHGLTGEIDAHQIALGVVLVTCFPFNAYLGIAISNATLDSES